MNLVVIGAVLVLIWFIVWTLGIPLLNAVLITGIVLLLTGLILGERPWR